MARFLLFLLGMLHSRHQAPAGARWQPNALGEGTPGGHTSDPPARATTSPDPPGYQRHEPGWTAADPFAPAAWPDPPARRRWPVPGGWRWAATRQRRRPPRWVWWAAAAVVALIFRRAVAWLALAALSGALNLVGVNVHLPSFRFAWPWQSISAGTTTNTALGPWVLQKIEGISRPALGQANFTFYFTHKVSKSIGPWPCWYAATFYAEGHASATVDLNPGAGWWAPGTGHYLLRVLSAPSGGEPGHVAVTMTLPKPALPALVHDITIDNTLSKPIDAQHSWTYPGLGCGVLLRPQFSDSVLYAQAQGIAFYKATHVPQVTGALVTAAEGEAVRTIRDNFIQPTVNALGYRLTDFTVHWAVS